MMIRGGPRTISLGVWRWMRLCDLKPAERNARTHSKKQIKRIAASIREFGFLNPVIVDDANMILAGHGGSRPRDK